MLPLSYTGRDVADHPAIAEAIPAPPATKPANTQTRIEPSSPSRRRIAQFYG